MKLTLNKLGKKSIHVFSFTYLREKKKYVNGFHWFCFGCPVKIYMSKVSQSSRKHKDAGIARVVQWLEWWRKDLMIYAAGSNPTVGRCGGDWSIG
jgi:hypothetical protein